MTKIEEQLIRDEGLRLKLYRCSKGKLTIGVGRNIEDRGITEAEAMFLLRNDIATATNELVMKVPFFLKLDPVRQDVLINMCVNLGYPRLSGFQKMFEALAIGDWDKAADEMLDSKWAREDVPARAARLSKQMRTCSYQD